MHPDFSPTDKLATALAHFAIRHRWLVFTVSLLFVFFAALGMKNLEFKNNYRLFFGDENPELATFESFQATYSKSDNLLFVIQVDEGSAFTPDIMSSIEWLTTESWKMPYATRVDSITNFQHTYAEGDDLIVEDLIEHASSLSNEAIVKKQAVAIAEPLLRGNLVSDTADTVGLTVTLALPDNNANAVLEIVEYARLYADKFRQKHPQVHIALSGTTPLSNAFGEASQHDLSTLIPAMYAFLIITTLVVLRSVLGSISTLIIIAFSSITAMGMSGHLHIPLTAVTSAAPTIIMTLAIADSIHILVTMLSHYRAGNSKHDAIIESVRVNFIPVMMTSLTTIIGFLTLNFSDSPPYWHLGNVTAIGIVSAWVFSTVLLPSLLAILPIRAAKHEGNDWAKCLMNGLAAWVIRHRKPISIIGTVLTVVLISAAPTLELNDEFISYFSEDIQFRKDADFTSKNLSGVYVVEYSIASGEAGGINNPTYLHKLESFSKWLQQQPEVQHVYSYTDIIKRLNRNMHNEDPAWYKIPESQELAAQYLLLYEFSLPFGMDMQNRISIDKASTRLTLTVDNISSLQMQLLNERTEKWMQDNLPTAMQAKPTGTAVMFSYIAKRNTSSMLKGNAVAIIIISFIMLALLRNFKLGFISLLANTFPIVMMFGVWALLIGQVGMIASTVAAATLGIVVDDTVHFLSKYLRAMRELGMTREQAIHYTFETVGVAIFSTTIILVIGFSILMLSDFQLNSHMGSMSSITIVIALLFDFLFLPAVLLIGNKSGNKGDEEKAGKHHG